MTDFEWSAHRRIELKREWWDPTKHIRWGAGNSNGGQFKGGLGGSKAPTDRHDLDRSRAFMPEIPLDNDTMYTGAPRSHRVAHVPAPDRHPRYLGSGERRTAWKQLGETADTPEHRAFVEQELEAGMVDEVEEAFPIAVGMLAGDRDGHAMEVANDVIDSPEWRTVADAVEWSDDPDEFVGQVHELYGEFIRVAKKGPDRGP